MSFWTGFTTGLVGSIDRGLRTAMDKRDKELSSARKFWMERQAQKAEKKEAYDERAVNTLKDVIKEAGGDPSLGLAIYNQLGLDEAESLLTDIRSTRKVGENINLLNMITLPQGFADQKQQTITTEQALASVKKQMKGITKEDISVNIKGQEGFVGSFFDKLIGMGGNKEIDKIVSDVNSRYKPDQPITFDAGIYEGLTIDRSDLASTKEYQMKMQKAEQNLQTTLDSDFDRLVKEELGLDLTTAQGRKRQAEIGAEKEALATAMKAKEQATSTSGGATLSSTNTFYTSGRKLALSAAGIIEGTTPQYFDGGIYRPASSNPAAYAAKKKEALDNYNNEWLKNNANTPAGQAFLKVENYGLKAMQARQQGTEDKSEDKPGVDAAAAAAKKAQDAGFATPSDVVNDPQGYIDFIKSSRPSITNAQLRNGLIQSGVPIADVDKLIPVTPPPPPPKAKANAPVALTSLTPGSKAYKEWVDTYGQTHNPDGTPK